MKLFGSEQGKDPRTQQWTLEDFGEYFRNERGNLGNSRKFQEVISAFDRFSALQGQKITQETAIKMVKANEDLKKACNEYAQSRRGARTGSGKERLAVIDCLDMFREDLNLDQARDMRVVRGLEGKTWGQAGKFKVAEIVLDGGDRQVVGAAMSQRMKVEHGGKQGFFTEEFYMESMDTQIDKLVDGVDREKDPALGAALEGLRDNLKARMKPLANGGSIPDERRLELVERYDGLEEGKEKEQLKEILCGDPSNVKRALEFVQEYQTLLKQTPGDISPQEKARLMDRAAENTIKAEKEEYYRERKREFLTKDRREALINVPFSDLPKNRSVYSYRYIRQELIQAKNFNIDGNTPEGRQQREAIDRAIEDREFMNRFLAAGKVAEASDIAAGNAKMKVDEGNELTSRNIASSRMAELLGIGNIIAHSEKMVVRSGDKVSTGCFMEFAEGVDRDAKGERTKRVLDQVEMTEMSAGFNKDMTTLEVFDFLCAQTDRHARNIFYKLSEPDAAGKRSIIGLQGIDSDLAFGDMDDQISATQGAMNAMTFISAELAEKVNALDEDTLRYAIGDLIPEHQIQAMMKRVEKFKDHMNKNMVTIEKDGWDLNEYSIDQPTDQLDARGKAYVAGLKGLDKSLNKPKEVFMDMHKSAVIKTTFNVYHQERAAEPKVAISFAELKAQEKSAQRRDPKMTIGKKSERAVERARQMREERRKQAQEPKKESGPSMGR